MDHKSLQSNSSVRRLKRPRSSGRRNRRIVRANGTDSGLRSDRFLAHGQSLNQILSNAISSARLVAYGDPSLGADLDFGFDDVFLPIAFRGGNIPGQTEIRQRGERDVVGAADA